MYVGADPHAVDQPVAPGERDRWFCGIEHGRHDQSARSPRCWRKKPIAMPERRAPRWSPTSTTRSSDWPNRRIVRAIATSAQMHVEQHAQEADPGGEREAQQSSRRINRFTDSRTRSMTDDRRQDEGGHAEIVEPLAPADHPLLHAGDQPGSQPAHQADQADRLEPGEDAADQVVRSERWDRSRGRTTSAGSATRARCRPGGLGAAACAQSRGQLEKRTDIGEVLLRQAEIQEWIATARRNASVGCIKRPRRPAKSRFDRA